MHDLASATYCKVMVVQTCFSFSYIYLQLYNCIYFVAKVSGYCGTARRGKRGGSAWSLLWEKQAAVRHSYLTENSVVSVSECKQTILRHFIWPKFENGKLPSAMCSTFTFHLHFSHWHAAQKKESLTRKCSVSLLTNLVRCALLRFLPSCKNSLKLFMALCHFSCHEGRHERKLW